MLTATTPGGSRFSYPFERIANAASDLAGKRLLVFVVQWLSRNSLQPSRLVCLATEVMRFSVDPKDNKRRSSPKFLFARFAEEYWCVLSRTFYRSAVDLWFTLPLHTCVEEKRVRVRQMWPRTDSGRSKRT